MGAEARPIVMEQRQTVSIFNERCRWVTRAPAAHRPAITARGCDNRSVVGSSLGGRGRRRRWRPRIRGARHGLRMLVEFRDCRCTGIETDAIDLYILHHTLDIV